MAMQYMADGGSKKTEKTVTPAPTPTPETKAPAPAQPSTRTPTIETDSNITRPTTVSPTHDPAAQTTGQFIDPRAPDMTPKPKTTEKPTSTSASGMTPEEMKKATTQQKQPAKDAVDTTGVSTQAPSTMDTVTQISQVASTMFDTDWEKEQQANVQTLMDIINKENKYLTQLNELQFDYDPFSDQEYLRSAAGLENQVAQMMTGRGGIYSSVAASALRSGLVDLQIGFRNQKYNQFVENRNFVMNLAQMEMQNRNTYFNQILSIQQDQRQQRTEEFNRFITIAQMEIAAEQQQYENSFREAQFRQSQIDNANRMAMERERLDLQIAERQFQIEQMEKQEEMDNEISALENDFAFWTEYHTNFARINDIWARRGATDEVVEFYDDLGINLSLGDRFYSKPDTAKRAAQIIHNYEKDLRNRAFELNQGMAILEMIKSVKNPTTPTMEVTERVDSNTGSTTYKYITEYPNAITTGGTMGPEQSTRIGTTIQPR